MVTRQWLCCRYSTRSPGRHSISHPNPLHNLAFLCTSLLPPTPSPCEMTTPSPSPLTSPSPPPPPPVSRSSRSTASASAYHRPTTPSTLASQSQSPRVALRPHSIGVTLTSLTVRKNGPIRSMRARRLFINQPGGLVDQPESSRCVSSEPEGGSTSSTWRTCIRRQ